MGSDSLRIGEGTQTQPGTMDPVAPQETGGPQIRPAGLAPAAMRDVMQQTRPPEGTAQPPAETLAAINTQSALLGEDRIGDPAELETSLALHADMKLDAENPPHLDAEGKSVQDVPLSPELEALVDTAFTCLEDPKGRSTPESAKETALALEKAITALSGKGGGLAPLRLTLEEGLRVTQIAVESHEGLPTQLADESKAAKGTPLSVRLRSFSDLSTTWRSLNTLAADTKTLLENPDGEETRGATERLQGKRLLPEHVEACRTLMSKTCAVALREALAGSPVADKFSDKALELVARMTLESGEAPGEMLRAVELAMAGVVGPANAHDIKALEGILEGMLSATTPHEKAGYVDMLFMGAYPEGSDAALLLKKSLVAEDLRAGMTSFHTFTMSRHVLLNNVFKGIRGKSDLASQLSARSFLLTPELATKLCAATGINNFKYHMAHVALLQARAVKDGFLAPEVAAGAEAHSADIVPLTDMKAWGEALGLQDYIGEAGRRMDSAELADAFTTQVSLAAERFNKGFIGEADLKAADKAVQRTAAMTTHVFSSRYENNIYHTSPEFMARKVLDDCIVNLTGILEPEKRLIADVNIAKNGAIVDGAIRSNLHQARMGTQVPLKEQAMFSQVSAEIAGLTEYRDSLLDDIKGARRPFLKHIRTLREMADTTNELVRMRAEQADKKEEYSRLKALRDDLSFSWPHQRSGRTRVCETVMKIAELHETIARISTELEAGKALAPTDPAEHTRLAGLESDKQKCLRDELALLRQLKGVNVAKMNYSGNRNGPVPDIETVLAVMRPRAEAVRYFASGQAEATLKSLKRLGAETKACIKKMNEMIEVAQKVYGKETLRQLATSIRAATLKVFVESGQQASAFSVNDPEVRASIVKQLATWGIQAEQGYFASMVTKEMYCLCDRNGNLSMDSLQWLDANFRESSVVKESKDEMLRQRVAGEGFSPFVSLRMRNDLAARRNDALRQHGIHSLMEAATVPGGGFVYDYKRGVAIKSGTDITADEVGLVLPLCELPVSLQLGFLHSDALTVQNAGSGAFSVTLKTENAANIAASIGLDLGPLAFAGISGTASAGKAGGIYLRFPSKESCETFLTDFMNPQSALHKGDATQPSWLAAQDIRLLRETSASASLGVEFSAGNFQANTLLGAEISLLGVGFTLQGNTRHTTTRNAQGVTDTFSRQFSASFDAYFSELNLVAKYKVPLTRFHSLQQKLEKQGALARGHYSTAGVSQTFSIQNGEGGLKAGTSMTMALSKRQYGLLEGLTLMHVPEATIKGLAQDTKRLEALAEAWEAAPPDATMKVTWKLRPEALDKAHSLVVQARGVGMEKRAELMRDYHTLLAGFDAYEPASLEIARTKQHNIAHNASPDVGLVKFIRNTSFTGLQEESFSLALPEARLTAVEAAERTDAFQQLEKLILSGVKREELEAGMAKALEKNVLTDKEADSLYRALDRLEGIAGPPPGVQGQLTCIPWRNRTDKFPFGVCEAATSLWLERISREGPAKAGTIKPVECNPRQGLVEKGTPPWTFALDLLPGLLAGSTFDLNAAAELRSQGAGANIKSTLSGMAQGDFGYIAASRSGGNGHAMAVFHGSGGTYHFFDPNNGIYSGSLDDVSAQMTLCCAGWSSVSLTKGHMGA